MAENIRQPRASLPAKLAVPSQTNISTRSRLFRSIDAAWSKPVLWVSAPAGAGKTTLAASYLVKRQVKPLWYQLDARDTDPATFFAYLRQAVGRLAPRKRESLPHFTPEYQLGLRAFTQNFFEQMFTRLHPPTVLVFDNYQDVPDDAPLHNLLPVALSLIPDNVHVIILSRTAPPSSYAGLRAAQMLALIDADQLRLTLSEAADIAHLVKGVEISDGVMEQLHARVGGWAAGWILVLERALRGTLLDTEIPDEARELMFDYFASELFTRTEPLVQELLLKCAVLPHVRISDAVTLCGYSQADKVFKQLVRTNMFTTRLAGAERVYQFHPLFREFLLARGRTELGTEVRRALNIRAAGLLASAGQPEQSVELLREAGDVTGLLRLIMTHAPALAEQGRYATLQEWLNHLPDETIASQPWLQYWLGGCKLLHSLADARRYFSHAYEMFKQRAEPLGMYLAWTGVIDTLLYEWDDFSSVDYWLGEIGHLLVIYPLEHYPTIEPRVVSSALNVVSFSRTDVSELEQWVHRAESLFERSAGHPFQVVLASGLQMHYAWVSNLQKLKVMSHRLESLVTDTNTVPFVRLYGICGIATGSMLMGEVGKALYWSDYGYKYGQEVGIHAMEHYILSQALYACEIQDDVEGFSWRLERMQPLTGVRQRVQRAHYDYHSVWLEMRRGNLLQARKLAEQALALTDAAMTRLPTLASRVKLAEVLVELGEYPQAFNHLDQAAELAEQIGCPIFQMTVNLMRALALLRQGNQADGAQALARALRLAREEGYTVYPNFNGRIVAELCRFALELNIETDYVRMLIRLRNLQPVGEPWLLESWSWPVKIYTLGRFTLLKDGTPLNIEGKNLELLKALVAFGGRAISEQALYEALWPDADGDMARQRVKVTLHRLRKLAGADLVTLQNGRLSLNPRQVWVDAWAFERLLGIMDRDRVTDNVAILTEKALHLYHGGFLDNDTPHWGLAMRERLRSKFLRVIGRSVELLCAEKHCAEAVVCYQKAIETDPLAERFYRGLMRCHHCLRQPAEGLAVYRRCRDVLGRELGIKPSEPTESLHAQLRALTS